MPSYPQEETVTGSFSIVQFSAIASFFMLTFKLFGDKPAELIRKGYKQSLAHPITPHQHHSFVNKVLKPHCRSRAQGKIIDQFAQAAQLGSHSAKLLSHRLIIQIVILHTQFTQLG